eukprot:6746727-Pyramimonas_sp.AAC.1
MPTTFYTAVMSLATQRLPPIKHAMDKGMLRLPNFLQSRQLQQLEDTYMQTHWQELVTHWRGQRTAGRTSAVGAAADIHGGDIPASIEAAGGTATPGSFPSTPGLPPDVEAALQQLSLIHI